MSDAHVGGASEPPDHDHDEQADDGDPSDVIRDALIELNEWRVSMRMDPIDP